jgi:hypothetical protein
MVVGPSMTQRDPKGAVSQDRTGHSQGEGRVGADVSELN